LNMIGQVAITAGINIAAAIYIIGAVTRLTGLPPNARVPFFGSATSWSFQLSVMVVILIPQVAINVWGIRLTARLSDLSVWWHIGGVFLIAILLSVLGRHHNPLAFLFAWQPVPGALASSTTLVIGDAVVPSPLFRLIPGLAALYAA